MEAENSMGIPLVARSKHPKERMLADWTAVIHTENRDQPPVAVAFAQVLPTAKRLRAVRARLRIQIRKSVIQ
jgi:hypothetical protein